MPRRPGYGGAHNHDKFFFRPGCNPGRAASEYTGMTLSTLAIREQRADRLRLLLIAALQGDEAAYRNFLTELAGFVRAFLRKRMRGLPDDIEDLVQETLIAVHNHRHTYAPEQPVTAWLHAIARYKLIDLLRRRSRLDAQTESIDDVDELLLGRDDNAHEAQRDLGALLEHLPDKQRLPIVHVKLEGRSVVETARLTGLSESAVKIGVHRGLKALTALLRTSH
ncbi:RNA polymerase sigma factor [Caldimonas brevitalea]|uniref:RNA polymerase sigma factor n=2 Tax=Caldimonas brevitalea TaxID=413882 RepID=A0A0G3BL72_9BURK|nr:RNA polymerase sigma factor [Caldimonas brevitalea]